jgi:predicted component of type VI protein secretion system
MRSKTCRSTAAHEPRLADAAGSYEKHEPDLGLEFFFEIRAAIQRTLNDPEAFLRLRESPTVRRILTRRFWNLIS